MADDYAKAFANIVKVVFPEVRAQADGTWIEEWEIKTAGPVKLVSADDLVRLGQAMSQADFQVEAVQRSEDLFVLRVVMFADAKQGRFLSNCYVMLRLFDEHLAPIAFVQGQPRMNWTPFRKWPAQE
ncbi:hypothetical protein [Corallococcus llansteffanensis]|uniref:Uncharacterized protein n=1 Tax=Corallococcus llansteffanensis TaxID=2316731 RepID=A0A3A8QDD5_9BACT|nr:hypothetical protein [Corallococcus llansteffanensis]RKH61224.1 hypothetical protein D7V93_12045 [Corallococcus llansteffanensis]